MIYFEVMEDLGDGSMGTSRFRTADEAQKYIEQNEEYCWNGYEKVDTDSEYFFTKLESN